MHEVYMSSDEETMTTATLSTVAACDYRRDSAVDPDMDGSLREETVRQFQYGMDNATDTHVSTCKSTYFFDGGKRFISVSLQRKIMLKQMSKKYLTPLLVGGGVVSSLL